MKKWYFSLLVAMLPIVAAMFSSCSKNDYPQVKVDLDVGAGGTVVDGVIYAGHGATLVINKIDVTNVEEGKPADLVNVRYYWDGIYWDRTPTAASGYTEFPTAFTTVGEHTIGVDGLILALGKSVAFGRAKFPVVVVEKEEDIPYSNGGNKVQVITTMDE